MRDGARCSDPRRGSLCLTALIVALLMQAGAAQAKVEPVNVKVKVASATVPLPGTAGATASATATCPRGTQAVGGGFATSLPSAAGAIPRIYESLRVGRRQWRASAANGSSVAGGVTVHAYCRSLPAKAKVSTVTASSTVPPLGNLPTTVNAPCPAGRTVLSGGFQQTPAAAGGPRLAVQTSAGEFPNAGGGTLWRTDSRNFAAGTGTVTSLAYCVKPSRPEVIPFTASRLVSGFAALPAISFNSVTASTIPCRRKPPKTKVAAGSFHLVTDAEQLVYESRRLGSKKWTTAVVAIGTTGQNVQNVGLCV